MQETSQLYNEIMGTNPHWFECALSIGENGRLMNERGYVITFAGTSILVGKSGGDSGYQEDVLMSMATKNRLFCDDLPSVGNAISGEIDVKMLNPVAEIPRMARLVPYVRVTDGRRRSEWIKKGVYYVDTRETTDDGAGNLMLTMHGYDSMLMADVEYDYSQLDFPATDIDIVRNIAERMGISIDSRTIAKMDKGYTLTLPAGYTARELLGYIASMYMGNFIMNDDGELRLVSLNELPTETRYLITNLAEPITFGGVRILV